MSDGLKYLYKTKMKVQKYENKDEWLEARHGRITGKKAGSLLAKKDGKPLKGYYELVAERVAIPASEENVMDRGNRLEDIAIEQFAKETGKKVNNDLVIWSRDDDNNIAISPDGYVDETEAVEVKCLNSAAHIEAWLTKKIPSEFNAQKIQYFVVNDQLQTLNWVFYDPRMPIDLFYVIVTRAEVQKEVDEYLEMERRVLLEVTAIENQLTF